jgi:hypothetical protein
MVTKGPKRQVEALVVLSDQLQCWADDMTELAARTRAMAERRPR